MNIQLTRRRFLHQSGVAIGIGATAPGAFCHAAATASQERILVVVEMAGGNDGLNTVIPHSDPVYRESRKALRIEKSDVLSIDGQLGFHPAMRGFADLMEQNRLAVVQGVGYANPNRSHFESMDIWHTCMRKDVPRNDGWIGRYLEEAGLQKAADPPALHLGRDKQPFALMSRNIRVPSIQSLEQFRLKDNESVDLRTTIRSLASQPSESVDPSNDLLSFVQSSTSGAIAASERIEVAANHANTSVSFPSSALGKKLKTVSQLIGSGVDTRVYYVRIDGFDTHANQPDAHAALLRDVSRSVAALIDEMNQRGDGDRVLVMCFSEFGRRVAENASDGTDHGTAGPVFFAGNQVAGGLVGRLPRLTDLENGDLKFHTDFRRVYATVLEQWLGTPSESVLGSKYQPVEFLKRQS